MATTRGVWTNRGGIRAAQVLGACLLMLACAEAREIPEPLPPVAEATIADLQDAMAAGRISAVQLVDASMARIAAYDQAGPRLNAMIRLNPNARGDAEALDIERATQGPRGPLHGIPVVLKDNYDTYDMATAAATLALAGVVPPDDGFQVRLLREAGAVIVGKTNMHELAMGITTISSLGGQTRNPYDLSRNPGGSSGGTGAAVAASFAVIGWGSDTCGSIRIPASQNNLFGLRPTKGLSSIDGIIPLSHSQDVGGPLARTATDLAIGLDATVGPDDADPATMVLAGRELPRFVESLDSAALRGARIGVLRSAFGEGPEDREMSSVVEVALEAMRNAGAEVVDSVDIPSLAETVAGAGVINHEFKFDFIDYLNATPGAPVTSLTEILDLGVHDEALTGAFERREAVQARDSDEYRTALSSRTEVARIVTAALERGRLDALVYPTMLRKPARIGDPQSGSNCQLSAVSGLPALSVPAGFTADGLPVGLELLGRTFDDARLLALGFAFEVHTHPRRSPATTPPLVDGRAPAPVAFDVVATGPGATARARFAYDATTSTLSYEVSVDDPTGDNVQAITIRRAPVEGPEEAGPGSRPGAVVVYRLGGLGAGATSGAWTLGFLDREALTEGRLSLSVHTTEHPLDAASGALVLPN